MSSSRLSLKPLPPSPLSPPVLAPSAVVTPMSVAAGPARASAPPADGWMAALESILRHPRNIRVEYQPIVDLQRGVVRGYEALARFPEASGVGPRDWFAAAARLGCAGALEAQVMQAALVVRPLLTGDRFVAVNLSPAALLSAEVAAVLAGERSLRRIVVEIVELQDGVDDEALRPRLDVLRERGALIAVDDCGAGYRSLDRVVALRPHLVKVDGSLGDDDEHDPARADMIGTLCELAAGLDAWVVAKGVETTAQLDALVRLGVPLGQGFALGRPSPMLGELDRALAAQMRRHAPPGAVEAHRVESLAEHVPAVATAAGPDAVAGTFAADRHLEHVVVLTPDGRPSGVVDRPAHARGTLPRQPLCVLGAASVTDAARRAMARPLQTRFDPVVCVDPRGAYAGIVPIDRMVAALVR